MKASVIISIYQSHGALARQVKYFNKMRLPDDVEFIVVDDGSNPPLRREDYKLNNLSIYPTGNMLAWTQGLGRNLGAIKAQGEYLLMTDIDHILSREAIEDTRHFTGDRMMFKRYFGILTEDGNLSQDVEVLKVYGFDENRLKKFGLYAGVHKNTFTIRKSTFEQLGGYDPKYSLVGYHPVSRRGDDCYFNTKWGRYANRNGIHLATGSAIYMFPTGRFHRDGNLNPKGLFHNLHQREEVSYKGEEYA